MKITKKLLPLFAITIFFGCSNIKVTSDSDKATDFTQYKSFSFLGWQEDSDKILNEYDKKRLRDAFNEDFSKRNLNLVEKN